MSKINLNIKISNNINVNYVGIVIVINNQFR